MVLMKSLVSQTWVLPPLLVVYVAPKLRYMAKYYENGGHFEIQDGRQN
jgi:hypothetical protein